MAFTTKIDYSNNRQIKQFQLTNTQLSGTTTFGVTDNLIPENVSGDTINIDALQYIRARGLILPNALPNIVSGGTYQLLGRDNITGKIVEVDALSGGTTGGTTNDYTTSATFNTSTGQVDFNRLLGGTYSVNLDGRYLTGFTETVESVINPLNSYFGNRVKPVSDNEGFYVEGSNNKATGYLANNTDTVGNAAIAGFRATINGDAFDEGVYLGIQNDSYYAPWLRAHGLITGKNLNIMVGDNTGDIVFSLGNTATNQITEGQQDKVLLLNTDRTIVAPSLTTALINAEATGRVLITKEWFQAQTITGGTTNTDDYLTTHTFNTSTGLFESTLQSGSTVSVNLDGRYSLNNHTHIGLSDDYLTGGTFNELTGDLDLNLKSGSTVTINLDDRYSLTTHTHNLSNLNNDIGFITASFLGIQKIKVTLSASQIENIGQGPVQLLPAAGVGTVINIISAGARLNFGTISFDDNTLDIADGSFGTATPGGFLSATSDQIERLVRNLDSGGSLLAENSAVIASGTSSIATGDGTVDIYLTYEIISL